MGGEHDEEKRNIDRKFLVLLASENVLFTTVSCYSVWSVYSLTENRLHV